MKKTTAEPTPAPTAQTGATLRQLRLERGVKAAFVCKLMDISASYLSDLEGDRRTWREELVNKYKQALGIPL